MTRVRVPSFTAAGVDYEVTTHADGLSCSCPAFDFAKPPHKVCKHITLVQQADDLLARCARTHGTAPGTLCRTCTVALYALVLRRHLAATKPLRHRPR